MGGKHENSLHSLAEKNDIFAAKKERKRNE
jgi:hypothetical protein